MNSFYLINHYLDLNIKYLHIMDYSEYWGFGEQRPAAKTISRAAKRVHRRPLGRAANRFGGRALFFVALVLLAPRTGLAVLRPRLCPRLDLTHHLQLSFQERSRHSGTTTDRRQGQPTKSVTAAQATMPAVQECCVAASC